jgi:hypothetical protein
MSLSSSKRNDLISSETIHRSIVIAIDCSIWKKDRPIILHRKFWCTYEERNILSIFFPVTGWIWIFFVIGIECESRSISIRRPPHKSCIESAITWCSISCSTGRCFDTVHFTTYDFRSETETFFKKKRKSIFNKLIALGKWFIP